MSIEGKGKYLGKRKFEIDKEINLSPDTEIFYVIKEIKPIEKNKEEKKKGNPWLEIARVAKPVGRSDLSVRHHEVLGDVLD